MKRFIYVFLAVIMLLTAACGADRKTDNPVAGPVLPEGQLQLHSPDAPEGVLRMSWDSPLATSDVHKDATNYILAMNIYDTLFETAVDEDGNTRLVNSLAEDYSVSEDGRVFSITLRKGVRFSNGTRLTAEDVEFTLTRMLALPESVQKSYADAIVGAQAVIDHTSDTLEGVRVIDDTHLEITLSYPFPDYLSMLSTPSCGILSKRFVTNAGSLYGTDAEHTLGTGAFMLTTMSPMLYVLDANPYYWGTPPNIEKVQIRVLACSQTNREFLNGTIDLISSDAVSHEVMHSYSESEEWRSRCLPAQKEGMLLLNLNKAYPQLSDARVRRAVQKAINRERIVRDIYDGDATPAEGLYPQGLKGYTGALAEDLAFDPEGAAALLKEAGVYGTITLELAIDVEQETQRVEMMRMICEDLHAAGFNAHFVNYDEATRFHLRSKGLLMAYDLAWNADWNDPDNYLYTLFGTERSLKEYSFNYTDTETIERIGKARSIIDEDARMAEYAALERKLVVEDAAIVPIATPQQTFVLGDRLKSLTPFWSGWAEFYFKYAELK